VGVPSSSDKVEQIESSFLRFELDEGIGVVMLAPSGDGDGEDEQEVEVGMVGTGALLAILALVLFGEIILELFGEVILMEFEEDIAVGGVGVGCGVEDCIGNGLLSLLLFCCI
jgi:hypothetical protein